MKFPVSRPSLTETERTLLLEAFDSGWITSGPMVERFEREFAETQHAVSAIATTSGTTALHLALAALRVGPGDEVIVPDLTYVATVNAIKYVGATPVLVDIDPETFTLDMRLTANAITSRTRVIMPVHLYGVLANMDEVWKLAMKHRLLVVEDSAESLGAAMKFGDDGDARCFSFFGNKIMTTGEGGMITTNSEPVAKRLRSLRCMANHPTERYRHLEVGFNYRMTDLQAAIGLGQVRRLPELLQKRHAVCCCYFDELRYHVHVPSGMPPAAPWQFTCELPTGVDRSAVMNQLRVREIETRPAFVPMHEMFGGTDQMFPVASRVGRQALSLPTYPDLTPDDATEIAKAVLACL